MNLLDMRLSADARFMKELQNHRNGRGHRERNGLPTLVSRMVRSWTSAGYGARQRPCDAFVSAAILHDEKPLPSPPMFPPMTDMPRPQTDDSAVDDRVSHVLDWLSRPAVPDTARELAALRAYLAELSTLPISVNQFHRILELFSTRADNLWNAVATQLLRNVGSTIARDTRLLARQVDELEKQVCEGYMRVLYDIEHRAIRNRRRGPTSVAGRALKALHNRLVIAAYLTKPAPTSLWQQAHRLFAIVRSEPSPDRTSPKLDRHANRIYREMLALAVIQPERLSGAEVSATVDYLTRFAPAVVIRDDAPATADYRLFWVDLASDSAPIPVARRLPDASLDVIYFSCQRLGTLAAEHLRAIEEGTDPRQLLLPTDAAQPAFRGLLHKLHESWAEPPTRHLLRRRQHYRVRMAVGLAAIACRLDNRRERADEATLPAWRVYNESPSGYALVHEAGETGGVVAGEIVAIRADSEKPWDICVVRRVLNERYQTLEIGLQVLASSARPVRLAFRRSANVAKALHIALWLPALPALRSHDAMVVAAGVADSQRFIIVAEEGNTHVTQGRVVSHDLHTAYIELFQFQDDPFPL
jgi:hypothetical protein